MINKFKRIHHLKIIFKYKAIFKLVFKKEKKNHEFIVEDSAQDQMVLKQEQYQA